MKSYLALASGVTDLTRQRAVAAAKALVSQGEATAEQVGVLAEDLLAQTKANREAVVALVSYEVDRTLARVGLAQADEVAQLTQRVRTLEAQLRAAGLTPGRGASAPEATAAAQQASGQQAPAKRAPATKAPATKAPATKAPAKTAAAKKSPARKAPAKTAPAGPPPSRDPDAT